jgi:hypothetical protein
MQLENGAVESSIEMQRRIQLEPKQLDVFHHHSCGSFIKMGDANEEEKFVSRRRWNEGNRLLHKSLVTSGAAESTLPNPDYSPVMVR